VRKNEAPSALAARHDFRHQGFEIVPIGAEPMQPNDRGIGSRCRLDVDGV
jgi:hypothetical protein